MEEGHHSAIVHVKRVIVTAVGGISLLIVPGKVYEMVLIERMMNITEGSIGTEQGGFRREEGFVDQIFSLGIVAEKDRNFFLLSWIWRRHMTVDR